jgi:hypothetical protein
MKTRRIPKKPPAKEHMVFGRTAKKAIAVRRTLAKIAPEMDQNLLALIAVDLADTWEIGNRHRQRMATLLKMKGTQRDRKVLGAMLEEMLYCDVIEPSASIEQHLPGLIDALVKSKPKKK